MNETHRIQNGPAGLQIEVVEHSYRQQMEHPTVEVTVWESIDESYTFLFQEQNVAQNRLGLAGPLLGSVPRSVVDALEGLGYELEPQSS